MNKLNLQVLRRSPLALAVTSALAMLAAPALADPLLTVKLFRDSDVLFRDSDMSRWADNYFEFGLGYNSKDSFKFGEYTGLHKDGAFGIAGFNWLARDARNDASYWRAFGANLGLDSRKLQFEGGRQGAWNLSFGVDQLTRYETESAQFVHQGLGSNSLSLPAGFAPVASANLVGAASLKRFDVKQGRDTYRLGLNGQIGSAWDYKVTYREDQRDGTRQTGFVTSGGATRTMVVPYPVDDRTQIVEATLGYTSKVAQLQIGYTYSKYDNDITAFRAASPFSGTPALNQMSLSPSNDYQQLNVTGAYNLAKQTRLTGQLSYGVARQNEAFLPYTLGTAATPLPRSSLDGKVVKTLLDVALTTKPIDKMNLKVGYQYRENDHKTPISRYLYASRDGNQPASATNSGNARQNAPMSTKEQKLAVDADYRITDKTLLRAGYERRDTKYTLADRSETNVDKLSLELRRPVGIDFLGSVGYTHSQKRGSDYDKNAYFRNTYYDPTFQNNSRLVAHPSVRNFIFGDYNEDRLRTSGNWTASETVTLQAGLDAYQQRSRGPDCSSIVDPAVQAAVAPGPAITAVLPDTCLGRRIAEGGSVNFDIQWQPEENLTTFAFINLAQTETEQAGRTWNRLGPQGADTTRDWTAALTFRDQTFGLGLKWQPREDWDIGGTYVFNDGLGKTNVVTGSAVIAGSAPATPVPDIKSKLHALQLFAKWSYSKRMDFRFNYLYENLRNNDWAYDNVAANSVNNALLTGQAPSRYSNHVIGVSAVIRNW